MHQYSVGVAIFDFLPVMLTALGLTFLVRTIRAVHHRAAEVARLGALLIPMGGFSKASWKLILASGGEHIAWLENLLFICLAPGFVILAFCLHHARAALQSGTAAAQAQLPTARLLYWLCLPLLGGIAAAWLKPETRIWFFWLLGVTTLANATLIIHAVLTSRLAGIAWSAPACFLFNFCATLLLSGLSRLPPSDATAWMQETVNFSAQAALAAGFWLLAGAVQASPRSTS